MGVSNSFHGMTLTEKIPDAYISILNFKLLDYYGNLSPFGFINKSKASLIDLRL